MRGLDYFIKNLVDVYESVPEGILITDLKGKIYYSNKKLNEFCGFADGSLIQKQAGVILKTELNASRQKTLKNKKAFISKIKLSTRKNSSPIRTLVILLETEHKAEGYIYIFSLHEWDIKSNPYSNQKNSIVKVLNAKQNEIWFISDIQKLQTLFCSESIINICGWTNAEFTIGGWAFSFLMIHPSDRVRVLKLLSAEIVLRNAHKIIYDHIPIKVSFRFRNRNNTWVWFRDRITVLERDENGLWKYMIGSITTFDPSMESVRNQAINSLQQDLLVKDGKTYVNLDTLLKIQKKHLEEFSPEDLSGKAFDLSNREKEVLMLIIEGYSSEEISTQIHVTKNTVNMHRKQIMKKMGARNIADLVRKSIEIGVYSLNAAKQSNK